MPVTFIPSLVCKWYRVGSSPPNVGRTWLYKAWIYLYYWAFVHSACSSRTSTLNIQLFKAGVIPTNPSCHTISFCNTAIQSKCAMLHTRCDVWRRIEKNLKWRMDFKKELKKRSNNRKWILALVRATRGSGSYCHTGIKGIQLPSRKWIQQFYNWLCFITINSEFQRIKTHFNSILCNTLHFLSA